MSKGIIFKGNLDEGDYKLIKTIDGWVLQGETSYIGFDTDTPQAEWIDLIKRSDVLEVVYRYCPDDDGSCSCADRDLREMLDDIEDIPSVDRPQGEWIKKPHKVYLPRDCEPDIIDYRDHQYNEEDHSIIQYWWHCNQCDYEASRLSKPTANFCPNCGARMRPRLQGKHFDSIIIDECAMKGADDE